MGQLISTEIIRTLTGSESIVKPNASKDEVEKVLDGGETGPIFAQSIVMTSAQMEAGAALSDIQNRHEDIVRIERSIIVCS